MYQCISSGAIYLYIEDFNHLEKRYAFVLSEEQAQTLLNLHDSTEELRPVEIVKIFENCKEDYQGYCRLFAKNEQEYIEFCKFFN